MLEGHRTYVYGKTRREVIDGMEKSLRIHAMGLPIHAGREPLSRFMTRWLEDCVKPRNKPRTYRLYLQQVEAHITPTLGEIPLVRAPRHRDQSFRRIVITRSAPS
jgi:hypothetical protein